MELEDGVLHIFPFLSVTLGIVVLFVGKRVNDAVSALREFSIPEPVTGGLLVAMALAALHLATGVDVEFELTARNVLLVYFFTTIGINAKFGDLVAGGRPLVILLAVTLAYMFVQNIVAVGLASAMGFRPVAGLLAGTVSLIGGHGTAIAWAPRFASEYGIPGAMEVGVACATFGLVLASLMGGPIARLLITRHELGSESDAALDVGVSDEDEKKGIDHIDLLDAILAIHVSVIVGALINEGLENLGLQLPLFVTCLFAGILLTNLVPVSFPRVSGRHWPSRQPAMAIIADLSLGCFLAMSLMSIKIWVLVDLALPLLLILSIQFAIAVAVTLFVVFPAMGRSYDAAVISAGFGGISLGSTPTAMANMSAVAQRYGASHTAFIVVPLVCAFFIDLANALLIPFFLARL
jgi:ESS family glutamate:Na+ symporter